MYKYFLNALFLIFFYSLSGQIECDEYTICQGGSIEIACVEETNYCPKWLPEEGLDNSMLLKPTANPEVTTDYTLYLTDDEGNLVSSHQTTVNVIDNETENNYLANLEEFIPIPVEVLQTDGINAPTQNGLISTSCFEGYSNNIVIHQGDNIDLAALLPTLCDYYNTPDMYLTDNDDFENGNFDFVAASFATSEFSMWYHIFDGTCSQDYVFVQIKDERLAVECPDEDLRVSDWEFEFLPTDFPAFTYTFSQRSFGPWVDFGHFDLLPCFTNTHDRANSFAGDNRGFSFEKTKRYDGANPSSVSIYECATEDSDDITSRIHHSVQFTLGETDYDCQEIYSSGTYGADNFIGTLFDNCEWNCEVESDIYGFTTFDRNTLYVHSEGADKCISFATDIDLRSKLSFNVIAASGKKYLEVRGFLIHKNFPAHEYFLEDHFGNKVFLHTFSPENEAALTCELAINIYDGFYPFHYMIEIDPSNGAFLDEIVFSSLSSGTTFAHGIEPSTVFGANACHINIQASNEVAFDYEDWDINSWNNYYLSQNPAEDCDGIPCCGNLGSCDETITCE